MVENWMKLANVARMSRHLVNTTGLCERDLPDDLYSFITSQMGKIVELEIWERKQLAEADSMPIQQLQTLVDQMWSGWVRTKLCEFLEKRS